MRLRSHLITVRWAVEGAVGSEHKIDATYLSPHVNVTMMLEGETKRYGVSNSFADLGLCFTEFNPVFPVDFINVQHVL